MRASLALLVALALPGCRPAPYLVLVDPQSPPDPPLVEGCVEHTYFGASESGACLEVAGHFYTCGGPISGAAIDCRRDSAGHLWVVDDWFADQLWSEVGWSPCSLTPEGGRLMSLPRCAGL